MVTPGKVAIARMVDLSALLLSGRDGWGAELMLAGEAIDRALAPVKDFISTPTPADDAQRIEVVPLFQYVTQIECTVEHGELDASAAGRPVAVLLRVLHAGTRRPRHPPMHLCVGIEPSRCPSRSRCRIRIALELTDPFGCWCRCGWCGQCG